MKNALTFWNDRVASMPMEKPQRGLSIQPRVAQHVCVQATLGVSPSEMTTLKGLDRSPRMPFNGYNPFRVEENLATITQGSPLSRGNRWAERWNRLRGSHQHTHMAHACSAGIQGFPRPFKAIKRYPSLFKDFEKSIFFIFVETGRPASARHGRNSSNLPSQSKGLPQGGGGVGRQ